MTEAPPEKLQRALWVFARAQYSANADLTLAQIYTHEYAGYRITPALLPFLHEARPAVRRALAWELRRAESRTAGGLAQRFAATTQARIFQHYQFLTFSAGDQAGLYALYVDYLAGMAGALRGDAGVAETGERLRAAVLQHFAALQEFVAGLVAVQGQGPIVAPVVCEEYPARLQLGLLGLEPAELLEPILDVGCGRRGDLVRALRQAGYEAFGLDRSVAPAGYLIEADWLRYPLRPAAWGTIISHMAFSNHFIFHHVHDAGAPETYARRFMQMLAALRPGGSLIYSPGLPFIERFLPATEYAITRRPVPLPRPWEERQRAVYGDLLGETPLYTTRIVRRAP